MFFCRQDEKLYYEYRNTSGSAQIPLLMLHGWGCDHSYFQFFANHLSESMPVLTLDFPAHGQSPEPKNPWEVSDFSNQVIALLDELKISKVRIFAHSFGGRVAIKMAAEEPNRIESMVITGGAGLLQPASRKQQRKKKRYKCLQSILNKMKKTPFLAIPVEKLQKEIRNRHSSPDYLLLSEGMKKTFVNIVSEDLSSFLPKITAPVLLLWGEADTETPLWMGKKMEKTIPDAGLVVLEGGSHFAFLEQKERCLAILQSFWKTEA